MLDELLVTLLAIAAAFFFLSGPLVGWAAFLRLRRLEAELAGLRARLEGIEPTRVAPGTQASGEPPPARQEAEAAHAAGEAAPRAPEAQAEAGPPAAAPEPVPAPADTERRFAERWLVGLGAVALGLGGLFLAGWAIEQGLLGPRARVGLAWLTGLLLVLLAEFAHRRAPAGTRAYLVPAALAAGGLCALYGATLAASRLYGLIPPLVAWALLVSTGVLALALAHRFGALLALLGAIGALAAPLLIEAPEPNPWGLALYLVVAIATLFAIARLARWPWLTWTTALGGALWVVLFAFTAAAFGEPAPFALYLLGAGLAALGFAASLDELLRRGRFHPGRGAGLLLAVTSAGLVLWVRVSGEDPSVVAALLLASLAAAAAAWRRPAEHWALGLLAGAQLVAAATWSIGPLVEPTSQLFDPSVALRPAFWLAPEARPLATALASVALIHGLLGFFGAFLRPKPSFWAGLGVTIPTLALAAAWWRLADFAVSPPFAGLALALALLFVLLAERTARREAFGTATAVWAIGASAAVALGLTIALETAWLTVALALEIAAIGWVAARTGLSALRRPALVLLLVVLARLVLDTDLDAPAAPLPVILYAYGSPLLALGLAARLFGRTPAPPVVGLEGMLATAAVLLWVLLLTELLRLSTGTERLDELARLPMLTGSMLAWLLTGLALLRLGERPAVPTAAALAGGFLLVGGLLQLLGLVFAANPAVTGEPVGPWPILNLLLPAYLLPAIAFVWAARGSAFDRSPGLQVLLGGHRSARAFGIAALALAFLWSSLELRRWFHAPFVAGPWSDAEYLALSLTWLALAGGLLVAGIVAADRQLRAAALVVGGAAILKAFLFDLADLEGLYRAASFLALGLGLVAVGWLYRRFVAEPAARTGPR